MPAFQWYRRIPGATQAQVDKHAQQIQQAAEKMERHVTVDAPGDVSVTQQMTLTLEGTGTAWDQLYDIESVEHEFDAKNGYRMTITGKNSSQGDTGYSPSSGDTPSPATVDTPLPSSPGFTTQSGGGDVTPSGGGAVGG